MELKAKVGRAVRCFPGGDHVIEGAKGVARGARTYALKARFGRHAYLACGGISVCSDLESPTYAWYDGSSPNLERDRLLFRRLLPFTSGSLFLDVGAHFGYFAAMFDAEMVAANRDGKVIAVEPDPDAFFCLQQTVRPSRTSTTCVQAAVGRERGVTTLHRGSGTCLHTYVEPGSEERGSIPVMSIADLCGEVGTGQEQIAFVKIDVDGFEPVVMDGAAEVMKLHRALALIEFCPDAIRSAGGEPRAFFERLCGDFVVHWADWREDPIGRVSAKDHDRIASRVGSGVTDLLLSSGQLPDDVVI